jgi:hypothetical protein
MCARCGRDDGTALLPGGLCPLCWAGRRRLAARINAALPVVAVLGLAAFGAPIAMLAGLAVAGLVVGMPVAAGALFVALRLLRWPVLTVRLGTGPLLWHGGTAPRVEVRRIPGSYRVCYAPGRAVGRGAHRAVGILSRAVPFAAAAWVFFASSPGFAKGAAAAIAGGASAGIARSWRARQLTAGDAAASVAAVEASIRARRGDRDGALALVVAAAAHAPHDAAVTEAHADLLLASGDYAAAADRVDWRDETPVPAHRAALAATFAWAIARGGLDDRATEAWDAVRLALTIAPLDEPAMVAFAALLQLAGMSADAGALAGVVRDYGGEIAWYERAAQVASTPRS